MSKDPKHRPATKKEHPAPVQPPPAENNSPIPTGGPQFAQPIATPDPTKFIVKHGSDTEAYKILDSEGTLPPRPFPVLSEAEPVLTYAASLGSQGDAAAADIQKAGQIVFHTVGDTGNVKGPRDQDEVADKMVTDFDEQDPRAVPSFFFHLGDVIYSFGEAAYYYDQFYDTYRNYPAPIFAIAGNHDGMVAPKVTTPSLQAFLENFCAGGQPPHRTPEAGELARTAQIQPGVYFTFEAPFVRILAIYSNCLEDPGVISSQGGKFPYVSDAQITFLETALKRVRTDNFAGAVIIAVHHPPYVTVDDTDHSAGKHGASPRMLQDIDTACASAGVWPHAILSGHAHNYQRFTRRQDGRETPFLVIGNGGHAIVRLTGKGQPALRVPATEAALSNGSDSITFESYDDQEFGYVRAIVDPKQLRFEYHPASDGAGAKTPNDFVTVDLAQRKLVHYVGPSAIGS